MPLRVEPDEGRVPRCTVDEALPRSVDGVVAVVLSLSPCGLCDVGGGVLDWQELLSAAAESAGVGARVDFVLFLFSMALWRTRDRKA